MLENTIFPDSYSQRVSGLILIGDIEYTDSCLLLVAVFFPVACK